MSADLPLTVNQVREQLPGARGARRVSIATVTRWIISGSLARNGKRIKLRATRCGSRWLIHQTDLDQFFAALAGEVETPPVVTSRKDARRLKKVEREKRELQDAGC
jgi:hypothetical protein